jgi:hypothetical protein
MFILIAPQRARHTDGCLVQIANRNLVECIDGENRTTIYAEFVDGPDGIGTSAILYLRTLQMTGGGSRKDESPAQQAIMLDRIVQGLSALGVGAELWAGGSEK